MNLPTLHERVSIVQEAEIDFSSKLYNEVFHEDTTLDQSINMLSQSILNLSVEENKKVFISENHKKLENLLGELSNKYGLTYGEKVKMLTSQIQTDAKYVIRWERHKDLSKEGDWA